MRRVPASLLLYLLSLLAAGCDQLGIESATAASARKLADGKAIGGACRQAGRAIEDCYALNKRAEKAAMFAGWREMNEYMIENKLEAVSPVIASPSTKVPTVASAATEDAGTAAPAARSRH